MSDKANKWQEIQNLTATTVVFVDGNGKESRASLPDFCAEQLLQELINCGAITEDQAVEAIHEIERRAFEARNGCAIL